MNIVCEIFTKKSGGRPRCVLCDKGVKDGQLYMKLTRSWRNQPSMHHDCLKIIYEKMESEMDKYEVKRKEVLKVIEAQNKKLIKLKDKKDFNKSIVKAALKTADIFVSKISITQPEYGDDGVYKIAPKGARQPFVWLTNRSGKIRVIHPMQSRPQSRPQGVQWTWNAKPPKRSVTLEHTGWFGREEDYKTYDEIPLADPDALTKIGKLVLKHSIGDLTPYMKKPK